MLVVVFEFRAATERREAYWRLVESLQDEIARADGLVSLERFAHVDGDNRFLSLSTWRDAEALAAWRNNRRHRAAQRGGREGVFEDYRLRVCQVLRDYSLTSREQAPADSRTAHE